MVDLDGFLFGFGCFARFCVCWVLSVCGFCVGLVSCVWFCCWCGLSFFVVCITLRLSVVVMVDLLLGV